MSDAFHPWGEGLQQEILQDNDEVLNIEQKIHIAIFEDRERERVRERERERGERKIPLFRVIEIQLQIVCVSKKESLCAQKRTSLQLVPN
jgi:hypothetical protein